MRSQLQRSSNGAFLLCLTLALGLPAQATGLPDLALQKYSPKGRQAVRAAMANGLAAAPGTKIEAPASRFERDDGHPALARMAKAMAGEASRQASLQAGLEQAVRTLDQQLAGTEFGDDMVGGVSMLVFTWHTLATGKDLSSIAGEKVARQLQAVWKVRAVERLDDRDKQMVHEWAIGAATVLLLLQQQVEQAGRKDTGHQLAGKAGELLGDLFGVPAERLGLDESGLRIKPEAAGKPVPADKKVVADEPTGPPPTTATEPTSTPLPEPEALPTGTPQTWKDYAFLQPEGWSLQAFGDGVLMQAPATAQAGESTWIALLALRPAEKELPRQALSIVKSFFGDDVKGFVNHESGRPEPFAGMERGVTQDGFPFVELSLAPANDHGYSTGQLVKVLLFQVGDQVAPVIGFDSGLRLDNPVQGKGAWMQFWYGLSFLGHQGQGAAGLPQQLVGTYVCGSGNSLLQETFGADGSYSSISGHQTTSHRPADKVLVTTRSWFGEGRYVVQGNRLTVWPKGGKPSTSLFRLAEQANSVAPSGFLGRFRRLCRDGQGQIYEYVTTRQ